MSVQRYAKTKDSGVEWLGEVPEHWDVVALKRIASLKSGDSITAESIEEMGDYPVLGGNGLRGYTSAFTHDGHFVVIGRQGALCGNINYATGKFWASEHAVVASPLKQVETIWLGEMLRAMNLNQHSVTAAQPGLSMEFVGNLRTALPPIADQSAIAEFLDRETAKIDALVGEQRRLIELLNEKRQAVISHAVTKGLNPRAPMKPSGIEWLGDVPDHWEVIRIGRRIELQRGVDITKDEQNPGIVPVVSSGGIASFHDHALVSGPGVIVGRKGTAGAVYYIECDYWPHDTTLYVKKFEGNIPRFVFYKLCSMELASYDTGSANPTINRNLVHPVLVPWPPISEQVAIAAFLDDETAKLDALTAEAQRAIDLLQERRTALISAAVTGKIDVRGLAESEAA